MCWERYRKRRGEVRARLLLQRWLWLWNLWLTYGYVMVLAIIKSDHASHGKVAAPEGKPCQA